MIGYFWGVSSFLFWGLVPLYWMHIKTVQAVELTLHRVCWGSLLLLIYFLFKKTYRLKVLSHLKNKTDIKVILVSTFLIGTNWGLFIYAVQSKQLIAASLGYFINPIFNIFLARIIFQEKLSALKIFAVVLALIGILFFMQAGFGNAFITIGLLSTFGLYGALRKSAKNITPLSGLFWEMLLVAIPGVIYLFTFGEGSLWPMQVTTKEVYLIPFAGLATILPLFWYNIAVKELKFSTLAIIQYLAPTLQFLLGYFVFKELVTMQKILAFGFVWLALVIDTYVVLKERKSK